MGPVKDFADSPNIRPALKAFNAFVSRNQSKLSDEKLACIPEIRQKLRRLEADGSRLTRLNNQLLDLKIGKFHFDEANDTLSFQHDGQTHSIKLKRANPSVPLKIEGGTRVGSYPSGDFETDENHEVLEIQHEMESLLESFYSIAFRVTKLAGKITDKPKYHCHPITQVRNKLIEHPVSGSLYSFGFSSDGALVKPQKYTHLPNEYQDRGLTVNANELAKSLKGLFDAEN